MLMNPMTPHLSEEIWEMTGEKSKLSSSMWPRAEEEYLREDLVTLPIQINGKRKTEIQIKSGIPEDQIKLEALNNELIKKNLKGVSPKKVIVVPDRIVNIVI